LRVYKRDSESCQILISAVGAEKARGLCYDITIEKDETNEKSPSELAVSAIPASTTDATGFESGIPYCYS
jgi:hypothetical protein